MVPKYPRRLSAKRGDASSFRHSIWPKCVLSPSVKRYRSLATLFLLLECEYRLPAAGHFNTPHIGVVALFPKAGPNGGALLLHHRSLIGNRLRGPHIPNELLHYALLAHAHRGSCALGVQEVIVVASRTPRGRRRGGRSDGGAGVLEGDTIRRPDSYRAKARRVGVECWLITCIRGAAGMPARAIC
jgi:hypothetical protein